MFGAFANGTLPCSKYNCSLLQSNVSIIGFHRNFWFGIESIVDEDQMFVKIFHFKYAWFRQTVSECLELVTYIWFCARKNF